VLLHYYTCEVAIVFLEYAGGLHIILREEELGQNGHTQRTRTHTRLHHLPVITGLYFYICAKDRYVDQLDQLPITGQGA